MLARSGASECLGQERVLQEIFNQKTYPSNTVEVIGNNQVLIKRIEEICAQGKVSDR